MRKRNEKVFFSKVYKKKQANQFSTSKFEINIFLFPNKIIQILVFPFSIDVDNRERIDHFI